MEAQMQLKSEATNARDRRSFLTAFTTLAASILIGDSARVRAEPTSAGPADPALIENLVAAN